MRNNTYKKIAFCLCLLLTVVFLFFAPTSTHADTTTGGSGATFDMGGTPKDTPIECGWSNPTACIVNALYYTVLAPAALLLGLSGIFLNLVIEITIKNFSHFVSGTQDGISAALTTAWTLIRDVLNMVFIFLLLWIGIGTIIGADKVSYQKQIPKIVLAGLLINFSFFFTSVLIDFSNVTTVQFYEAITKIGEEYTVSPDHTGVTLNLDKGLSGAFMSGLRLKQEVGGIDLGQKIFQAIFSIVTFLVAAFLFFAMATMLIARYVILIMLLITSPIMFMGGILPQLNAQSKKWWNALNGQLLFAPVFMLFMLLVVLIINSAGFHQAIAGKYENVGFGGEFVGSLLTFAIVIGLMVFGLVTSKQFAGAASSSLTNWAEQKARKIAMSPVTLSRQLGGAAGRNIIGRGAEVVSKKYDLGMGKLSQINYNTATGWKKVGAGVAGVAAFTRADEAVRDKLRATAASRFDTSENLEQARKAQLERKRQLGQAVREDEHKKNIESGLEETTSTISAGTYNATSQTIDQYLKAVAGLSNKEIEQIFERNLERLQNADFAGALTADQMDFIGKSDLINDAVKDKIKTARTQGLMRRMGDTHATVDGNWSAPAGTPITTMPDEIDRIIAKPADAVKLPAKILTREEVAVRLSANVLKKLADGNMSDADKATIRTHIENAQPIGNPVADARLVKAQNYLSSPAGFAF